MRGPFHARTQFAKTCVENVYAEIESEIENWLEKRYWNDFHMIEAFYGSDLVLFGF